MPIYTDHKDALAAARKVTSVDDLMEIVSDTSAAVSDHSGRTHLLYSGYIDGQGTRSIVEKIAKENIDSVVSVFQSPAGKLGIDPEFKKLLEKAAYNEPA